MQTFSWSYIKEKWTHTGFQRYLKNTGWMFAARVFILTVAFFINAYMARYLGPGNYGLLNYVFSFVGLFSFIASLGIESIANREIIKNHEKKNLIIGTSFYLKLIGSLMAILIIFIFSRYSTNDAILLGLITMYSFSYIFSAFNIVDIYFQSQVLSKYPAIVTITAGIISTILKIIAMTLGAGIIWLTAIYVLESIIVAAGLLFFFIYKGHSIKEWVFNKSTAIMILNDSWPLMLSSIAIGIYMKIDQVMIKNMLGNEQAGIYAVAVKLSEVWYFIPGIICSSLFPSIVNAVNTSTELFENRLRKLYFSMFWISTIIASFITIFSYPIIKILFGVPYLEAVPALRIYVWAGIFVSIGGIVGQFLLIKNLTKISFYTALLGSITNVILNMILIPNIGVSGAAIATIISYAIAVFGILLFDKSKHQGILILKSLINYK